MTVFIELRMVFSRTFDRKDTIVIGENLSANGILTLGIGREPFSQTTREFPESNGCWEDVAKRFTADFFTLPKKGGNSVVGRTLFESEASQYIKN